MSFQNIMSYISSTKIFGIIPLDMLAHSVVGYIVIFFLLKRKIPFTISFIILLVITIAKELYDMGVMTNTLSENLKDIAVTMFIPVLMAIIRFCRRKETY